jgi:ketosteroid isomerase-like protein
MSGADVETLRRMYDAFNRGDYEESTAMLHEDAELHQTASLPDFDTYVGREEFVRGLSRWLAGFEPGFQYRVEELIEGPERVFMRCTLHGTGRGSGAEIQREAFNVWEVRDGRPFRLFVYWDEGEARAAAGFRAE